MKQFILELFAWWHSQTLSMRLRTLFKGQFVGEDAFGNKYYTDGKDRRWVIYNGPAEPSAIPSGWHGWMHRRTDTPPSREDYAPHAWEQVHLQNLTGTSLAYRPEGSLLNKGERPRVTGDYDAWSPE